MRLSKRQIAEIQHLSVVEEWSRYALAQKFSVHHSTICKALKRRNCHVDDQADLPRVSKLIIPHLDQIQRLMRDYPKMPATRMMELLSKSGYKGSVNTLRRAVLSEEMRAKTNPRAFSRREVFAGQEAQVDWLEFGKVRFAHGEDKIYILVIILSWSRDIFARAFTDMKVETLCRGHTYAFKHFQGIPALCLYDNMKTVVIKTNSDTVTFNEDFLSFSTDHGFRLRNCNPRQPQEKGRVERSIRYLRSSFFPGRDFLTLQDLNEQLLRWLTTVSRLRPWPDGKQHSVEDRLIRERTHLAPLPNRPWYPQGRVECRVHKIPYVQFQRCKYSVPPEIVGKQVILKYDDETVEVWDNSDLVAIHARCYLPDKIIEASEHIVALAKKQGRGALTTRRNSLIRIIPNCKEFIQKCQERGNSVRSLITTLYVLLEEYGADDLNESLARTLDAGSPHLDTLIQVIKVRESKRSSSRIPAHLLPVKAKFIETIHQDLGQYSLSIEEEKE